MRFFKLLLFLVWSGHALAQVTFSKIPVYLQLFARDSTNYGHFDVKGASALAGTLRSVVSELGSNTVVETFSLPVNANDTFVIHHKIPACLKEYKLEIFLKATSSGEERVELVTNLVAGDFFIVDGQSNAECPAFESVAEHDSSFYNPFTRVIGTNFSWAAALSADSVHPVFEIGRDCQFLRPSSTPWYQGDFGFSGIWPISLQDELARATGIPNCFINGSQGATGIATHFASHTPSIPDSLQHSPGPHNVPPALLYDRIYKKLYANNAITGVKGIFWYQGESDGNLPRDSSSSYGRRFRTLYNSWKADYPSLKKIIVLQINMGCGGEYHNLVRETQRKFPQEYPDVAVMSTIGSSSSDRSADLCHYTVAGYTQLAAKLLPLVEKYIYNFPLEEESILPADIQKAYYTSASQICLEFDKNILLQDSCVYSKPYQGTAYLKDYFFREETLQIRLHSVTAEGNKVFLNLLPHEPLVQTVTYLPKIFTTIPSLYAGPWILTENNRQLGAYAFTGFPVEPPEQTEPAAIYPNPAKDYLEIRFTDESPRKILIYDLFGKCFRPAYASGRKVVLDTSALPAGVYLLVVNGPEGSITRRFIITGK